MMAKPSATRILTRISPLIGIETNMRTYLDSKAMAKAMRERLAEKGIDLPHSEALEIVAQIKETIISGVTRTP